MKTIIFEPFEINNMPKIDIKNILKAYKGKPNRCMCGCSGTYFYSKDRQKEGGKDRGYDVTINEINDKEIIRIVKLIDKKDKNKIEVIMTKNKEYIFTKIIEKTQYTIYLK